MTSKINVSDRARAHLRGLVKVVSEGEGRTEYDLEGKLLSWHSKNPDGSDYGDSYTYDADGRLLSVSSRAPDGSSVQKSYAYDDKGRLLSIRKSDGEHSALEYDELGRKTETRVLRQTDERGGASAIGMDIAFADVSGELILEHSLAGNARSFKTFFNDQDQPTETSAYASDGHLLAHLVRRFDAQGRIAGTRATLDDPTAQLPAAQLHEMIMKSGLPPDEVRAQFAKAFGQFQTRNETTYSYDSEGRIEKIVLRSGLAGAFTRTYTYNDQGDVIAEHTVLAANQAFAAQAGLETPQDTTYRYTYDGQGNWTEKTIGYSKESSFTVRREISYH